MTDQQRVLVAYFSATGHTHFVAQEIAEATDADLLRIRTRRDLPQGLVRYVVGGFQALFGAKPKLEPVDTRPADYDLVFLGTPVWAGRYVPAMRSFISRMDFGRAQIALFCTCDGDQGSAFEGMRQALDGSTVLGEAAFRQPTQDQQSAADRVRAWARQMIAGS